MGLEAKSTRPITKAWRQAHMHTKKGPKKDQGMAPGMGQFALGMAPGKGEGASHAYPLQLGT